MNKTDFKLKVFSLSERIFPMVARMLGSSENAEDAIQEIMLKRWEKRKQVEKHPNINGFVFLTAGKYCIVVLRKKPFVLEDATDYFKVLESKNEYMQLEWKEFNTAIKERLKKVIRTTSRSFYDARYRWL